MSDKTPISGTSLIERNESKFLASPLGEEIVMMNMDNGNYIGVNNVGSDIWNMIDGPITVEELSRRVLEVYDISEDQLSSELEAFLQRMLKQQMITITEPE
jgi:hypothetical protein